MRRTSFLEQAAKAFHVGLRHVAKLLKVALVKRLFDRSQEPKTSCGDRNEDLSTIFSGANALDEFASFQPIKHSRDVRSSRDQTIGDQQGGSGSGLAALSSRRTLYC